MKAVIAAYARSPFQFAKKGALAQVRPDALAAQVVRGLLDRTPIDPALLEDIILGCAYPEGPQGDNVARIVGFLAGLPEHVGGMTVNRFCGSSMTAIHLAAAQIEAGAGDAFLCVGVESMSMVPQGGLSSSPNPELLERYPDAYISMGQTAENVARRRKVSRAEQEELAVASHQKATAAREQGRLSREIVPIERADGSVVDADGCIRPNTTLAALAGLKPAFRAEGVVTAGTSSPLTDGASARIRSFASVGCDPAEMGMGPVPATKKALARAGLRIEDIGVVEINEAFSSQAIACLRELEIDAARVNLDGGGLAIGHPLGATGARIVGKAAALLVREGARYALSTQCVGGGQGVATILEAL